MNDPFVVDPPQVDLLLKQLRLPSTLTQIYIALCSLQLQDSPALFPPFDSLRLGFQVRTLGRLSRAFLSCPASAC